MDRIRTHRVPDHLAPRLEALESLLKELAPVAVGFSGGVDSTFLAAVCARAIPDRALLIHLDTPLIATPERTSCAAHGDALGLPVITIPLNQLDDPAVRRNDAGRCYHCKRAGFSRIIEAAREHGAATVIDGSNADDADDYRPGTRALRELGVRSPLMETGWHKAEERELMRLWGLDVWSMPAGACLATRIPCGTPLTAQALETVRTAEDHLHELGLEQVRARLVDGQVRIAAAPDDLDRLIALGGTPAAEGVLMPDRLMRELIIATGQPVERIARAYRSGAMNAAPAA